ncbi:hypothetical protein ColTof4_00288 [Colletotrichum tofieldiae]|nr:hypothetical protein ColTof3_07495 [Colletotrichum tofieldiae]GKT67865.1 hypothetical protein ColTof4_00288 [Colletotrichum tofieldiae]
MGKKMKVEHNIRDTSHQSGRKSKKPATKPKPSKSQQPKEAPSSTAESNTISALLPMPLQQRLLSTFNAAYNPVLTSNSLGEILQEVKAALYARDFDAAFAKARPEALDAYAARWSPTRALGYAAVFLGIEEYLEELEAEVKVEAKAEDGDEAGAEARAEETGDPRTELTKSIRMLSIGGGAAEIAAFAAYLSQQPSRSLGGTMALLDSAPWDDAVAKLHDALTTPPPLSKYANAAAKAANVAIIEADRLTSSFTQQDVLAMTRDQLSQKLGDEPLLVTLLFTLNELYTTAGIGKTTAFLLDLTATVPLGSLLLVVDSPGSYSEAAVGKDSKKYPMQWLMDHTLVTKPEKEGVAEGCRWEKLESHDSVWFRLADSLKYPIPLENMRYQMHLYRATKP